MKTLAILVALAAAACSSTTAKPGGTTPAGGTSGAPAAASKIDEGNGWTHSSTPGQWVWANDDGTSPVEGTLSALPGARGILVMDLPTGAHEADLVWVYISYASPGSATWSLVTQTEANGEPGTKPIWSSDVVITADQVGKVGEPPHYDKSTQLEFGDGGHVSGRFYLIFSTVERDSPKIGSQKGTGNVRYQGPEATTSAPTANKAMIRVVITDVK